MQVCSFSRYRYGLVHGTFCDAGPIPPASICAEMWGIWTGILAIVHTAIGLTVHLRGRMWMYFFKTLHPLHLQNTQFGFAKFTGLAAALLFLMLLAISNDVSLRALKTNRWKSLQRWTYVAFVLTAAHGIAYQLIEKRHVPWVLVSALVMAAVAAGQILGFVQVQRGMRPGQRAVSQEDACDRDHGNCAREGR